MLARWVPGRFNAASEAPVAAERPQVAVAGVFDADIMLTRFGGDREIAEIAVAGALESIPAELAGLRNACAAGDAATARRHAHTIKSLAASIAAAPCAAAAEYIEHQLAAGVLRTAQDALPGLAASYQELAGVLQVWLEAANRA
jgi:HPt (histidine-containing phosphotransfer) domain-containing protein